MLIVTENQYDVSVSKADPELINDFVTREIQLLIYESFNLTKFMCHHLLVIIMVNTISQTNMKKFLN